MSKKNLKWNSINIYFLETKYLLLLAKKNATKWMLKYTLICCANLSRGRQKMYKGKRRKNIQIEKILCKLKVCIQTKYLLNLQQCLMWILIITNLHNNIFSIFTITIRMQFKTKQVYLCYTDEQNVNKYVK